MTGDVKHQMNEVSLLSFNKEWLLQGQQVLKVKDVPQKKDVISLLENEAKNFENLWN